MKNTRTIHEETGGLYRAENPRKQNLKRYLGRIIWILLIGALVFSLIWSNGTFTSTEYTIQSPYLPNAFTGYKIAQISDLHGRRFGDKNEDLIEAIEDFQPDILVITGDLVDFKTDQPETVIQELAPLVQKYPTFYVKGNHELNRDLAGKEDLKPLLEAVGVSCLENQQIPIVRRESKLVLAGLQEPYEYYQKRADETHMPVGDFLGEKGDAYTILLAHNPLYWKDYLAWGADLTLSGHMHGGLVRLPFVGGLVSPEGRPVPSFDKGLYQSDSSSLLVSGGLGNSGRSFRLFNRQELVLITLESLSIH